LWEKKDKHCDPSDRADDNLGSWWDHVIIDAESKLIVSCVVGRRTAETALAVWQDFYVRSDGRLPELITTDEYPCYFTILVSIYGVRKRDLELTAEQRRELDYAELPPVYFPVEIVYATVHKDRAQGRVVRVEPRVVLGTEEQAEAVLDAGRTAPTINVSYVERWNGTQRHINARKARKVYTFSKDLLFHIAVTWLCITAYNWCWTPRTLREKVQEEPPSYRYRTPAMAAGLTAEIWTLHQVLTFPVYQAHGEPKPKRKRRRRKSKQTEGR
jgi:IS1 family transposase